MNVKLFNSMDVLFMFIFGVLSYVKNNSSMHKYGNFRFHQRPVHRSDSIQVTDYIATQI